MNTFLHRVCLLVLLGCLTIGNLQAQKITYEDVLEIQLRNSGPIISDKTVTGYYFFYKVDKIDRKTNEYKLVILDANLNEGATKKIIGTRYLTLQEAAFNGKELMFKFLDAKEKQFEFHRYNAKAELVSKKVIEMNKQELAYATSAVTGQGASNEVQNQSLFKVGNVGFVTFRPVKDKKIGYMVEYYPNGKTKGWKVDNGGTTEILQAGFLAANNEQIIIMVSSRSNIMSKSAKIKMVSLDVNTGKELYTINFDGENKIVLPMNAFLDNSGELIVLGQEYEKGKKDMVGKSTGLAMMKLNKSGKVLEEKVISWKGQVSKFLPMNERGKIEDIGFLYFHDMIATSDGKYFAIGEEYKKIVTGGGVAASLLTRGGSSPVQIQVDDIQVFKFDENFNLEDVKKFEKSKSKIPMPAGLTFFNNTIMAAYLTIVDGFDYDFSQISNDNSSFFIGYTDFDKEGNKKKDRETYFGTVNYKGGEFSEDRLSLETDASQLLVLPGKPGHILIIEYFSKEKRLDTRLEKVNF